MRAMAGGDRPRLLTACVTSVAGVAASIAGCSYDWSVDRTGPVDAGGMDSDLRPDVEVIEAGQDGAQDTSTPVVDSGPMGTHDTGAPPKDAGPSCAELTQTLLAAHGQAIACDAMSLMACMNTVQDECGCQVPVGGDPTNTTAFENAVAAFEHAGCSTTSPVALCPGTCPTVTHVCLAVDAGTSYACYP